MAGTAMILIYRSLAGAVSCRAEVWGEDAESTVRSLWYYTLGSVTEPECNAFEQPSDRPPRSREFNFHVGTNATGPAKMPALPATVYTSQESPFPTIARATRMISSLIWVSNSARVRTTAIRPELLARRILALDAPRTVPASCFTTGIQNRDGLREIDRHQTGPSVQGWEAALLR